MAQLFECDDCGALMTAELLRRHEAWHQAWHASCRLAEESLVGG